MKNLALIIFVGVILVIGTIGGMLTMESVSTWFPSLKKPSWNPPAAVFGPVWLILYILIGISAWRVWLTGNFWGAPAAIFGIQLALNLGWSWIFFYHRQPGIAFIEIILLLISIGVMMVIFGKLDRPAAWLLVPYLLWVMFASVLNYSIWRLNPPG